MANGHSPAILDDTHFRYGRGIAVLGIGLATLAAIKAFGQDIECEPISYSVAQPRNAVARLQERLDAGKAKLEFEPGHGYLRSLLRALDVPESSQVLVLIDNSAGVNVVDLKDRFKTSYYLTPHSDIVALMVLEHQTGMLNRLARAGIDTRMALHYEREINKALDRPADERSDSTRSRIRSVGEAGRPVHACSATRRA